MSGTIPRRAVLADGVWTWAEVDALHGIGGIRSVPDALARSEGWTIEAEAPQPEPGARIVYAVEQFSAIRARLEQIEREAV